jgi:hypothetical protein
MLPCDPSLPQQQKAWDAYSECEKEAGNAEWYKPLSEKSGPCKSSQSKVAKAC